MNFIIVIIFIIELDLGYFIGDGKKNVKDKVNILNIFIIKDKV